MLHFQANLLFPYVSMPSGATGRYQWRTFRVFKVFSEHLKMKKKIKKLVLGHSLAINDKNCLYLYRFSASG